MKILLIGNGFDLAHGLPTAYKDFLKYCTDIRQQMFLNDNSPLYEAYTHIRYNTWVDYFLNCQSYIGDNWIDFESEISRVIRALEIYITTVINNQEILCCVTTYIFMAILSM